MTDNYDDFENESGSTLRKQLEEVLAHNKKLTGQVESLQKESRQGLVESVVASRKLPSKLVGLVPADVSDKASVEKWLDDYADVFTPAPTGSSEGKSEPDAPKQSVANLLVPGTTLSTEQAFEVFQQVLQGAQSSTLPDGRDPQEALEKAAAEGGVEGIDNLMRELGLS